MPEQALCFLAGANSIFTGDKLLTTPNNDFDADQLMFKTLGLIPKPPTFEDVSSNESVQEVAAQSSSTGSEVAFHVCGTMVGISCISSQQLMAVCLD